MKKTEKDQARLLRKQGLSMNEIVSTLGVAKSSVSLWVRDVELTLEQKEGLSKKNRSVASIEKRRIARLTNERAKRDVVFNAAAADIKNLSKENLLYLGLGLYWGEGSKTSRGSVSFFNSDPRAIQIMKRFFKEICEMPDDKFRVHIFLHPHLDSEKAEQYWSEITGVPRTQFQKTAMQHNKASKNKKDNLPFGTCMLGVYDTNLYLKIMGWTEGIYSDSIPKAKQVSSRFHQYL